MNSFIRMFSFMKHHKFKYFLGLTYLAFFQLSFFIFISIMFKEMFDAIVNYEKEVMLKNVGFYLLLVFIVITPAFLFVYVGKNAMNNTTANIRKALFLKLGKLPISFYKKHHSGDIISRMTNDVNETEKAYSQYFVNFIIYFVTGIGSAIYTFLLDWRLAIVAIVGSLITLFVNFIYSKRLLNVSEDVQVKVGKLTERLTNILNGFNVIRCFNIGKVILEKFTIINNETYKTSIDRVNKKAVIDALNSLVELLSFVGLTAYGSYLIIEGHISLGTIIAITQLQSGINLLVNSLGKFITQIQGSIASSNRLFSILDEIDEPNNYGLDYNISNNKNNALELINVSFNYEDENKRLLQDITFNLPKGKVYALVGPSGSGKSTIIKLILNFYKTSSGNILINGEQKSIKEIRNLISYVPQDAHLFSGTIYENISYGKLDASSDEIKLAARLANCEGFINELPNGYDTYVGENGAQLSGGQKQRIAIARAILKDSPILLLDEATSSLDSESEALVQEAIDKLILTHTTLVIAHRLSTIQNADKIIVIKDGNIVEVGNHNELLELKGLYSKLYITEFALNN